jgi:hypothetical protein
MKILLVHCLLVFSTEFMTLFTAVPLLFLRQVNNRFLSAVMNNKINEMQRRKERICKICVTMNWSTPFHSCLEDVGHYKIGRWNGQCQMHTTQCLLLMESIWIYWITRYDMTPFPVERCYGINGQSGLFLCCTENLKRLHAIFLYHNFAH